MKNLVAFATAALLLVSCGDDNPNPYQSDAIKQINNCINSGGHPITSSDQYGTIFYIACDTNQVTP